MNRKITAIIILGVLVTLVVLLVASLVLAGKTAQNDLGQLTLEDSLDNYISGCKEAIGEEIMVMGKDGYQPKDLDIRLCTKVIFKNDSDESLWVASDIHPTHGIYPQFDPKKPVEAGSEWSFVFGKVGRWKYHDHLNPTIRGVIEVTE